MRFKKMIKKLLGILFLLILVAGFVVPGVLGIGAAPVANDDSYSLDESTEGASTSLSKIAAEGVLANDTDAEGDSLTAKLVTGVAHGLLSLSPSGAFTYIPEKNYAGEDSFTYDANDGTTNSPTFATVTITINQVDTPPTLEIDDRTVEKNSGSFTLNLDNYAHDVETPDSALIFSHLNGNIDAVECTRSVHILTCTTKTDATGTNIVTVNVDDGTNTPVQDTFTITVVENIETAPVADDFSVTVIKNVAQTIPVLSHASDADGDTLTLDPVVYTGTNGEVTQNTDGTVTYKPNTGYIGPDEFTYTVTDDSDDQLTSNTATVTISVTEEPPVTLHEFETRYNEYNEEYNKLDDDYDDAKRDYERSVDKDDEDDIEKYEDDLKDIQDDLDNLLDDAKDLDDDIQRAKDSQWNNLEDDVEELIDDIEKVIDRIDRIFNPVSDFFTAPTGATTATPPAKEPSTVVFNGLPADALAQVGPIDNTTPNQGLDSTFIWLLLGIVAVLGVIGFLVFILLRN
jgi:hypothetical protein